MGIGIALTKDGVVMRGVRIPRFIPHFYIPLSDDKIEVYEYTGKRVPVNVCHGATLDLMEYAYRKEA